MELSDVSHDPHIKFLHCNSCGKCVSTGFIPVPTATPDRGLIVRAWIQCPECIEKHNTERDAYKAECQMTHAGTSLTARIQQLEAALRDIISDDILPDWLKQRISIILTPQEDKK